MQTSKSPRKLSYNVQKFKKTYGIAGVQQDPGRGRANIVDQQIAYLVSIEDLVSCNKRIH